MKKKEEMAINRKSHKGLKSDERRKTSSVGDWADEGIEDDKSKEAEPEHEIRFGSSHGIHVPEHTAFGFSRDTEDDDTAEERDVSDNEEEPTDAAIQQDESEELAAVAELLGKYTTVYE